VYYPNRHFQAALNWGLSPIIPVVVVQGVDIAGLGDAGQALQGIIVIMRAVLVTIDHLRQVTVGGVIAVGLAVGQGREIQAVI